MDHPRSDPRDSHGHLVAVPCRPVPDCKGPTKCRYPKHYSFQDPGAEAMTRPRRQVVTEEDTLELETWHPLDGSAVR